MSDSPPPTPLDYARPSSNPLRRTHPLTWIALGVMIFLLATLFMPGWGGYATEGANRVQCGSHLREIGQAIMLYANEHQGRYPNTFGELLEEDITSFAFVCSSSNDTAAAAGPTTQASAANLHAGGHLSYIYLGKGITGVPPAKMVIAYEPLANHNNKGMNVLFGDGHVAFISVPAATAVIAELNAAHNPPRTPNPQKMSE